MDVHTILILMLLQVVTLFCVVGVVAIVINLKRAVDRYASAGFNIEERLNSLNSTLYKIMNRDEFRNVLEGLKENKAKGSGPD